MELESLKLTKFKNDSLKKEQMFMLNGGGTRTGGGSNLEHTTGGVTYIVDYSYDSLRDGYSGGITFHGYTNWRKIEHNCIQ